MTDDETVHFVREQAGVFDLSARRAVIEVRGSDRERFLQNLLSNDILAITVGEFQQNALLDKKSHVLAMFHLYRGHDRISLIVEAAHAQGLFDALDRLHFAEDIELALPSDAYGAVSVLGHCAGSVCESLLAHTALPGVGRGSCVDVDGESVLILCDDWAGEPLYECYGPSGVIDEMLKAAATIEGAQVCSEEIFDVLRLESGVPRFGVDVDERYMIMELDRQDALISFTKGCFPGQEIVARTKSRGTARRLLRGLVFEGRRDLDIGQTFQFMDKEGGEIRGSTWSPTLGKTIALAFLNKIMHLEDGAVTIDLDGERITATVARLPFYFPEHLQGDAEAAYDAGMTAFHGDDYDEAKRCFSRAIDRNPHYVHTLKRHT